MEADPSAPLLPPAFPKPPGAGRDAYYLRTNRRLFHSGGGRVGAGGAGGDRQAACDCWQQRDGRRAAARCIPADRATTPVPVTAPAYCARARTTIHVNRWRDSFDISRTAELQHFRATTLFCLHFTSVPRLPPSSLPPHTTCHHPTARPPPYRSSAAVATCTGPAGGRRGWNCTTGAVVRGRMAHRRHH